MKYNKIYLFSLTYYAKLSKSHRFISFSIYFSSRNGVVRRKQRNGKWQTKEKLQLRFLSLSNLLEYFKFVLFCKSTKLIYCSNILLILTLFTHD